MSSMSDDPYAIDEGLAVDPTDRSSKLNHPGGNPRMSRPRVIWGALLLMTAVIGDLSVASLQLGESFVACIFIGLWIAQYMALWLLIHSYITGRFMRILFGLMLTISIGLLAIVGMSIAWPPGIPPMIIGIILLGSVGMYGLAGWIQNLLLGMSNFQWFPKDRSDSSQFSIRMMLGAMVISALLAMAIKWLKVSSQSTPIDSVKSLVAIGIWFGWIAIGIGLASFLAVAAIRSKSRLFYISMFLLVLLIGPLLVQTVGLWIVNFGEGFRSDQRIEYYLWTYGIEAGLILGVLAVVPLLPSGPKLDSSDES